MNRNQFTFYRSYLDAAQCLPKQQRLAVLLAICDYALNEELPELYGSAAAIFALIKPTLDSSRKKAAAGQIGGSK